MLTMMWIQRNKRLMPGFMIASSSMPALFEAVDNLFQVADELLPAPLGALVVGFLIGTETGLLQTHMGSGAGWCQRKCDDGPLPQGAPGVGERLAGFQG